MKQKPRLVHFQHKVPIFGVQIHWIFCDNIVETFNAAWFIDQLRKPPEGIKECDGMVAEDDTGTFYIFFDVAALTHALINHELRHLVTAIFRYLASKDDELESRLSEYLTELTYSIIRKKHIKVKLHGNDNPTIQFVSNSKITNTPRLRAVQRQSV